MSAVGVFVCCSVSLFVCLKMKWLTARGKLQVILFDSRWVRGV